MPKLSPASEGAQSRSASPSWRQSTESETFPSTSMWEISSGSVRRREISSGSAPTTVSLDGTCSTRAWKAASRTGSPLRSSARPTNRSRSSSLAGFGPCGAASMSTPLGTIVYSPPNQRLPVHAAASRDCDARGELVEAATRAEQGRGVIGECLGRVGVEGADDRRAAEDHRVPADDRGEGLVDVDHVVASRAELPPQRDRALGEDREVGDRAVCPDPEGSAEWDEVVGSLPQLGVGAVQAAADGVRRIPGGEDPNVISPGDELLRQRLNVPVHAPLIGPGIRAKQARCASVSGYR